MNKKFLIKTIENIPEMVEPLKILEEVGLPNHYLAGGAVTKCVWNRLLGKHALYGVKDFDVVYFS